MPSRVLLVLPLSTLIGCQAIFSPDADDDGLSNGDESALGLDPDVADSDGDGLNDGDEVNGGVTDPLNADTDADGLADGAEVNGTTSKAVHEVYGRDGGSDDVTYTSDPTVADSDGDGYTDRDEVYEDHDPLDDRDKIYKGKWPYYFDKDSLSGGGLDAIEEGKRVGRLIAKDWYGDSVDLFDFYNADKPVVVDVSAQWCPPCNDLAAWLDNNPSVAPSYDSYWPGVREAVENGDIYWITILEQANDGSGATKTTAGEWHDLYPTKQIPVLGDENQEMVNYLQLMYFPTVFLLTPDLKVDFVEIDPNPYSATLDHLVNDVL